jgi:hypothetical protein
LNIFVSWLCSVTLHEQQIKSALLKGELYLALIPGNLENPPQRYPELINEEVVVGKLSSHPCTAEQTTSLAPFFQLPLVLFHEEYFLHEVVSQYSKKT